MGAIPAQSGSPGSSTARGGRPRWRTSVTALRGGCARRRVRRSCATVVSCAVLCACAWGAAGCSERGGAPSDAVAAESGGTAKAGATSAAGYEQDVAAQRAIGQLREAREREGILGPQLFGELRKIFERYPQAGPVRELYVRTLIDRKNWNALIELYSEKPEAERTPADQVALAKMLISGQRYEDGARIVVPMWEAAPQDAELCWLAGFALFNQGEFAESARVFDRGWEPLMAAGKRDALLLRALIHTELGEYEPAMAKLEQLLAADPRHVPGHNAMGRVLAAVGQTERAEQHIAQATALHAAINEAETKQARLSSRVQTLNDAFAAKEYAACERMIAALMPDVNGALQAELQVMLSKVYEATGRADDAARARAEAARLAAASGSGGK